MKFVLPLLVVILIANAAFSQAQTDSVHNTSTKEQLSEMPDSLKASWQHVDSVRHDFNAEADSLRKGYQKAVNNVDAETARIQDKIDSLQNLNIPPGKLITSLDSLHQKRNEIESNFNAASDKLKSKTIGKLSKVEMTPEMQTSVGELTNKIEGYSVSSEFVKIPPVDIPGFQTPVSIDNLALGKASLPSLSDNIPSLETPFGNINEVPSQVEGLGSDLKNISQGNLNDVQQIPETIEQQASQIDGMDQLQESSQAVDQYKNQVSNLSNPDGVKQEAVAQVKKQALNHFAGKEQQLKDAMEKMSSYKQKYSSVKSIKDLPKISRNTMKAKPFIERFVPGVFFQMQLKNQNLFDINPYVSYRITGKLTGGLGWNQRFAYDSRSNNWISRSRVYGPRAFADYKIGKGFMAHLEQEAMNTYVPFAVNKNPDQGQREWVWSTMLGMKKQYKIYKGLNGTVLIQYNLFNPYYKAPYLDRINSRMGFEYTFKKKVEKQ